MTEVQELIGQLPAEGEFVPLSLVRRIVNANLGPWSPQQQAHAVIQDAIRPAVRVPFPVVAAFSGQPGGPGKFVDRDQAILILVSAWLAFAGDVPVVAMIRALRATGTDPMIFAQAQ